MSKKKNIIDLIDKLAGEEEQFFKSEFLAPVIAGQPVKVRISGIITTLTIGPRKFQGWGVFKPIDRRLARFVRNPTMAEKQQYLKLFPAIRFVLCRQNEKAWLGFPAYQGDTRFKITGLAPIHLADEVQLFDIVVTRFDGNTIWFDELDQRRSPRSAMYLRESLNVLRKPKELDLDSLTQEERDAYNIAYEFAYEQSEEAKKQRQEDKIKVALERAGAKYQGHIERGDTYTVEYTVDGNMHRSAVKKDNLSVISAGICLAGHDRDFDLQSLVGVIRLGHNRGHVVNTEGRNWDQYGYGGGGFFEDGADDDEYEN